jgi:hypothetical protein
MAPGVAIWTGLGRGDSGCGEETAMQRHALITLAAAPAIARAADAPDDHRLRVFNPRIRGYADQFVFKFRKPSRWSA